MQQDGDAGESRAHTCRRVTDWAGCRWLTTVLAPEGQNGWAQALVLRLLRCKGLRNSQPTTSLYHITLHMSTLSFTTLRYPLT